MKAIEYILAILFYVLCFCCFTPFNPKLEKQKDFIKYSQDYFPNSNFVKVKETKEKREKSRDYTFNNNSFSFVIVDQVRDSYSSDMPPFVQEKNITTNYFTCLLEYKEEEIKQLCEYYDVDYYCGFFYGDGSYVYEKQKELDTKIDNTTKTSLVLDIFEGIDFNFYVQNKEDISKIFDLLYDIDTLLNPYYPKSNIELFDFRERIMIRNNLNTSLTNQRERLLFNSRIFPNSWKNSYSEMEMETIETYVNAQNNNLIK